MSKKQSIKKRRIASFIALCAFFVCSAQMLAQSQISGTVKDSKGETLIGVSVLVKGTNVGTISDINGNYSVKVSPNAVLQFTSMGYVSQSVNVDNKKNIDIVLVDDNKILDEVVVVGYGTMKKRDVTGSVISVDNAVLKRTGQATVLGALKGQTPGVIVTQVNGKLGTGYSIEVRGKNSISKASDPLVIVDGIIGADMNALNPADIEKIDVLKDVSATAIYGSRGANGVVIVTTKGGKIGKNVVTYDGSYGVVTPTNVPRMFNGDEYMAYTKEALRNGSASVSIIGQEKINADNKNYTDWLDYTLKNGIQTSHTVSLSGGSEKETHILSVGYNRQTGNTDGELLQRFNAKIGVEGKAGNFTLGLSAYARNSDIDNGSKEALRSAFRLRPIAQPTDLVTGQDQFFVQTYRPDRFTNPRFDAKNENTNINQTNIFGNVFIDYKILEGFTFRSTFSPYLWSSRTGYSADTFTKTNKGVNKPKGELTNAFGTSFTWDNVLNYTHLFNSKHRVNGMLGTSTFDNKSEYSYIKYKDLPYNSEWYAIQDAATIEARSSGYTRETMLSYMGRFNYSYDDKYLVTFTGRYDGSSKLAEGHKWGFFPSAAVAWRVSQEGFMKENTTINDLKLRFSYGESGNNVVAPYSTILGVSATQYDFNGTSAAGQYINRIPNNELSWEKSKEFNIGLDFSILQNRFSGTVDVYSKDNVDLIMPMSIPQTNGFSNISAVNVGSTRNQGIEVSLNTVNIQTKDFTWSTNFNFAKNTNKIIDIFGDKKSYPNQGLFIGQPVSVIYDYQANGIYQLGEETLAAKYGFVPGAVKVVDQNDDSKLDPEHDKVILGSNTPKWTGGITNTFTYKNFDMSVFVYTRQGEMRFSTFHKELANEYTGEINQLKVNYWTPENPTNDFYRPGINAGWTGLLLYKDCSFVRVGNITFGYNIPASLLKPMHVSSMRAYFTAVNPFVFTNYTGIDPEYSNNASYDGGVSTSTYMFGVSVKF